MNQKNHLNKLTFAGMVVAMGVVYGDLCTSPLYVFNAIIKNKQIEEDLIYGSISLIFLTLSIVTTIKYILLMLRADNNGEGGILSLYALVRKHYKYLYIPAIIGACCLLADGIITPTISISSAVEGLNLVPFFNKIIIPGATNCIIIILIILILIFLLQNYGTKVIGTYFGPIMILWIVVMFLSGFYYILKYPQILKALNPYYGIYFLINYPQGFWTLGGVFLCITGAEALYQDLGHCGRKNIQISWIFIKISLVVNYLGQGAWILLYKGQIINSNIKPVFAMLPEWSLIPSIVIATLASIIASQALITGAFTLISEAINLKFWPQVEIKFPGADRKINFIPSVNILLLIGCSFVLFYYKSAVNMDAAYGLSISITMICTSIIFGAYLRKIKRLSIYKVTLIITLFSIVDVSFIIANSHKLLEAFIIIILAYILISTMFIWLKTSFLLLRQTKFEPIKDYLAKISAMSNDKELPYFATHVIYFTQTDANEFLEKNTIDSLLRFKPKRADMYWFIKINKTDQSNEFNYSVSCLGYENIHLVEFNIGFNLQLKVEPLFVQVMSEMYSNGSLKLHTKYESLSSEDFHTDFTFVIQENFLSINNDLPFWDRINLSYYFFIGKNTQHFKKIYGLDSSNVVVENIPIVFNREEIKHKTSQLVDSSFTAKNI